MSNYKYKALQIGDTIGDMELIAEFRDTKNDRKMFTCRCLKCGRERNVFEGNIRNNPDSYVHESICGFGLKKQDPKFYDVWAHMKNRITNPNNDNYDNYGGRGLTTDYMNFVDFYDDEYGKYLHAKETYAGQRISLDRINNNVGYVRGNLRWTTFTRQTRNSRMVRKFIGVAPNGQVYLTNNQLQFGLNHGLESRHISDCLLGKQMTTAGWRFYKLDPLFEYQYESDPTIIRELYY